MKLLFDENLSPRLVDLLSDLYPESLHVHHAGLSAADDSSFWAYAKTHGFATLSKDSDFVQRSLLDPEPPKTIWLRLGNCATADVERLLRSGYPSIRTFLEGNVETCLVLGISLG